MSEFRAELRPALLLDDKKKPPSDIWGWSGHGRLVLWLRNRKNRLRTAIRIVDGISSLFTLFHGVPKPHPFVPEQIPRGSLHNDRLQVTDIEASHKTLHPYSDSSLPLLEFRAELKSSVVISEYTMAYIFFHLPTAVTTNNVFDGLHFYQESVSDFTFLGDDITEVLRNPDERPTTEADRIRLESSVLNAFRAVEALVGEPGKNEERFRRRLRYAGIDPDEPVGFRGEPQNTIRDRIAWLHGLRDVAASHGRRRRADPLSFREVMEAQHLGQAVVMCGLIQATSRRGRYDGKLRERRYLLRQMFGRDAISHLRRTLHPTSLEDLVASTGGLERIYAAMEDDNKEQDTGERPG